jgi:hypothetical protein
MTRSLASFKIQIVNDVWVSPYVYCIRTNTLSSLVRLPVRLIRAKLWKKIHRGQDEQATLMP